MERFWSHSELLTSSISHDMLYLLLFSNIGIYVVCKFIGGDMSRGRKVQFDDRITTSLRIDPDLLAEFRIRCFRDKVPYNTVVNDLIKRYLNRDWKYGVCPVHGREAVNGLYTCC